MTAPTQSVIGNLAALSNSVFASLGVAGAVDELAIGPSPMARECLVIIDGMGQESFLEYQNRHAIFSQSISHTTLNSHFPTTTTVNLTSLGTGVLPGVHGMLGYTIRVPKIGRAHV